MQFYIRASLILMMISVIFSLLLHARQGRIGLLPKKEQDKMRAQSKIISPFTMTIAGFLFLTVSFTFVNLVAVIIAIVAYGYSSAIAWKQFHFQYEESKVIHRRRLASLIANILTIVLGYIALLISIR